jgi:hypothetical protein
MLIKPYSITYTTISYHMLQQYSVTNPTIQCNKQQTYSLAEAQFIVYICLLQTPRKGSVRLILEISKWLAVKSDFFACRSCKIYIY